MRILFISHICDRSGASIALLQELRFLKENHKEFDADVLMLKRGELFEDFGKQYPVLYKKEYNNSIHHRILRKFRKEKYRYPYLSLCKKGKYDCIYANTVATFDAAIRIKNKLGIPIIGHVHEAESLFVTFNINGEDLKEFEHIITVSELAKDNLVKTYGYPVDKISIQHPYSIWLESYIKGDVIINPIKFEPGVFTIGLFCSGGWQKSLETLPFVISTFYKKYPKANCKFIIAGGIPKHILYHTEYDLKKMHLYEKTTWIGKVEKPLDYQAGFDVFLLLSREESFSLTAEEAAITGTSIVGFEGATGAAEWIKEGAGILVPYMNFEKMAEAIYKLYSDEELRTTMGKKGKEIITVLYNKNYNMETIINIIKGYEKNN